MKTYLRNSLAVVILFLLPHLSFAQSPPTLGTTSGFALFTAAGAFTNSGALTVVTGDVGTNVGAFSAFPPGTLIGQSHVADPASAQAATDVDIAYSSMSTITCGSVISTTMGGGQILLPNVYCLGAASTINGDLILDGQGDPNALFIFKIDGALATTVGSRILLTNAASLCNVYWQVNGQVDLGEGSLFRGTILANGAINLLEAATLFGRGLSRAGAISLHNNIVTLGLQPVASIITAIGSTTFCAGDSVILTGNTGGVWNTGATTISITVKTSGDYFVTNTTGCGSINSNHIIVTVIPLPGCTITGNIVLCDGQSTELCAPAGTGLTYLWSNGATTRCITVNTAGAYSVTVTNANGCSSTCSTTVTVNPRPACTITGSSIICPGGSTQLCAPAGTEYTYLWNTGATTRCITANAAGTYSVVVTNGSGCSSSCSVTVITSQTAVCTITGNGTICPGGSTQLCVAPVAGSTYLWSTGATTNCITVNTAGTYSVTVTSEGGCVATCSTLVANSPLPVCTISGDITLCTGQSSQLCVTAVAGSTYLWSTGATTNCITVNAAGTYSVIVTNAAGCSSTCSVTVTSSPSPVCTITGNGALCTGQSTQLCVTAVAGSTYLWNTGATTNCITVNAAGTYSVTVTSENGCVSICSKVVTISQSTVCTITGNGALCTGQSTQLCVTAVAGSTYLWNTGATTNCITVNAAGTYSVTVTSQSGCVSTCSKTVTISPLPVCTITGNSAICTGQSTQLCAPSGTGYTYLWSTGATTKCITVTTPGTYSVTVTNAGGCSSTCSKTITAGTVPVCTITCPSSICPGQSAQLCAPSGTGYTYLWSTGATTKCITVTTPGTYSVTVTNAGGCKSTCSRTITASAGPVCTITCPSSICPGQSAQLCAPSGTGYTYLWSTGATTKCITVTTPGTYSVTVTNAGGCKSTCSRTITASAGPVCTITCPSSICPGQSAQLCAPSGTGYTYLWSTGATTKCITVTTPGTYSVTVTNAGGCKSTCSRTITSGPAPICTITSNNSVCQGQSTQLCAPYGTGYTYLWNTGATSRCITVSAGGTYSVTVTNAGGCKSTCSKTITTCQVPECKITGNTSICQGQSTQLCAPSGSGLTYLWSNGATTRCITVSIAKTYSVTVTNEGGCSKTCSKTVTLVQGSNYREAGETTSVTEYTEGNVETKVYPNAFDNKETIRVRVYPNPFTSKTVIEFKTTEPDSHVMIELYSLAGNKIATLFNRDVKQAVPYKAEVNGDNLSAGIYICRITDGHQVINRKLILVK